MTIPMNIVPRALAALLIVAFTAPAAHARWLEARSPSFIVYSESSENDLRDAVQRLDDYDRFLRQMTGTTSPTPAPLPIYLVRSNDKLQQVRPVNDQVLGFYTARVGGTLAMAVRGDRSGLPGQEVLFHEYAHHFMMLHYPAAYPAWYVEGFAEYMMTAQFEKDRIEIGRYSQGRAITLVRGQWMPVERLVSTSPSTLNPYQTAQFYAESWLLVHYIFAAPERRAGLTRYLDAMQRGTAEPAAFQTAFGMDHKAFDKALRKYMNGSIAWAAIPRPQSQPGDITVRALPPGADDLLLPELALSLGVREPEREAALLATIRSAAALHPGDAFAQRALARAEIASGDRAAGTAIVDRLLVDAPRDASLLYIRGLADFYTGRKDPATRAQHFPVANGWFSKATEADPTYYQALYRQAQTLPRRDGKLTDTALNLMIRANKMSPLVSELAFDVANALMVRGQFVEAELLLIPLAYNPHGGGYAARALELLADARAHKAQPPAPQDDAD